jgi:hypothetical protein
MLEVILNVLFYLGVLTGIAGVGLLSFLLYKKYKKDKETREEIEYYVFQENFQKILISKNKEMVSVVRALLDESLEIMKEEQSEEDYAATENQAFQLVVNLEKTLNDFSKKEDKSNSILSLIMLENQLANMADSLEKQIMRYDPPNGRMYD